MIEAAFFYLYAIILVVSAFMVIVSRNPVHSVLFLILAFFNGAALFVMLGAELLGMLLLIVYVGAVAVLFLFVVMMLDIDFAEMRKGLLKYLPVGGAVGVVVMLELLIVFGSWAAAPDAASHLGAPAPEGLTNTEALGQILYTKYVYFFQLAGLVLLVAMIGAIVLTLHHRENVKRQNIPDQIARTREMAVELKDVEPGQGI
ncbi:MAG: NADH-quinone oxidoreductase subunit J [Hyphomicrobiales bacterium]|nr:MAG: NADH-quinone oxidoreductase subunit J [Hyphomicrobiales bacterium]